MIPDRGHDLVHGHRRAVDPDRGRIDLGREWGALAMLAVCWLMLAAVLVVGVLAVGARGDGSPVRQTLEAMLAANRRRGSTTGSSG
jgi:hypothetical protein